MSKLKQLKNKWRSKLLQTKNGFQGLTPEEMNQLREEYMIAESKELVGEDEDPE
jgi:hypothetical protein